MFFHTFFFGLLGHLSLFCCPYLHPPPSPSFLYILKSDQFFVFFFKPVWELNLYVIRCGSCASGFENIFYHPKSTASVSVQRTKAPSTTITHNERLRFLVAFRYLFEVSYLFKGRFFSISMSNPALFYSYTPENNQKKKKLLWPVMSSLKKQI